MGEEKKMDKKTLGAASRRLSIHLKQNKKITEYIETFGYWFFFCYNQSWYWTILVEMDMLG